MKGTKRKGILIVGFVLTGLALLSFSLDVLFHVTHGDAAGTYRSVQGFAWHYWSAFVVLLLMVGVLFIAGVRWLVRSLRTRRGVDRDA